MSILDGFQASIKARADANRKMNEMSSPAISGHRTFLQGDPRDLAQKGRRLHAEAGRTAGPDAPWQKFYSPKEKAFQYEETSIYEYLRKKIPRYGKSIAYNYFGKKVTFPEFLRQIDEAALAFYSNGIRIGDVVTICMPNTPEAIISFYALNKIGAISNMIHPLSGEQEIKRYLIANNSVMLVMLDRSYSKIKKIIDQTNVYKAVIVSVKDSMPAAMGVGYQITQGYKDKKPAESQNYIDWKSFIACGRRYKAKGYPEVRGDMPAVILHSGGTTGVPKGIVLSNNNFNAMTKQFYWASRRSGIRDGDSILAILPIFHGFGLGICIHAALCSGNPLILLPRFNADEFGKILKKYRPNVLLGVPTLYEALADTQMKLDLSFLKLIVCGGDSLSMKSTRRINHFLKAHNCTVKIAQGYGMTECLAAVCFGVGKANKEGSIGIPLVGNHIKIVDPATLETVPYGTDGEICIHGPTVMMGYLDNEKETNEMLRRHKDGNVWLHSGDIGYMDEEGFVFYRQRLKRMIVSSGYNVYPSHVEQVVEEHESVLKCIVVGVPHPYKVEAPKAFIVLKQGVKPDADVESSIKAYCEEHLSKFSVPYEFEFRESLPKTKIGKVDFKLLQEEELAKLEAKRKA